MSPEQREVESRRKAAMLAAAWEEGAAAMLEFAKGMSRGMQTNAAFPLKPDNPYRESEVTA